MPNGGHIVPGHDPYYANTGDLVYPYKSNRSKPIAMKAHEPIVIPDLRNLTTKAEAIQILSNMRAAVDPIASNATTIEALEIAIHEIGKCASCNGIGYTKTHLMTQPGYKVKVFNGRKIYLYPCTDCKGGKRLGGKCFSCGKDFQVMMTQEHYNHCNKCEEKLKRAGTLA